MLTACEHWKINEICISNNGNTYILFEDVIKNRMVHGVSKLGQLCMTLKEAKDLLQSLETAIKNYEDLEESCNQYFANQALEGDRNED